MSKKQSIDGKKIKVHCTDITIELKEPEFSEDNLTDCYGHYIKRKNLIQINKGLSDIDEANTIFHELMHSIAWLTCETNDGGALDKDDVEERIVNNFSNYWIGIFRENKWLLDYLKEKL
tara:strand:- start:13 stop:369 length:357 start_codon:yes stop_codon:yes gene_type:complete